MSFPFEPPRDWQPSSYLRWQERTWTDGKEQTIVKRVLQQKWYDQNSVVNGVIFVSEWRDIPVV